MKLLCQLVRRNAAAFANNELRHGWWESLVRRHLDECSQCRLEVDSFREVSRLVASARPSEAEPRVQWDDVRRTILARREEYRRRVAAAATVRRGAALALTCGTAAVALWFVGPILRDGLAPGSTVSTHGLVTEPTPQPQPMVAARPVAPPPARIHEPPAAPVPLSEPSPRSVTTPPVRTQRFTLTAGLELPPPDPGPQPPAQTIAVELSPNANTGAVEAAVVSPNDGSLLIDT